MRVDLEDRNKHAGGGRQDWMPGKMWGEKNKLHSRLRGFISLSEMISLTDNATHHPLWSLENRQGGEATKGGVKRVRENEDIDEERKAVEETGRGSVETCQASAPPPPSQ